MLITTYNSLFLKFRHLVPAIAFFGGFVWDAFTIGRAVRFMDLWLLLVYLLCAGALLWWLGYKVARQPVNPPIGMTPVTPSTAPAGLSKSGSQTPRQAVYEEQTKPKLLQRVPYLLLQFLFGGLFSALFIFYIKSADHALAFMLAIVPGALLIANEFIHDKYRRFTLTWALFGLCAILLFNFLLPFIIGSIHFMWFYLSTLAGLALVIGLRHITPGRPGKLGPVWLIALLLALAYPLDVIPPVPLVKRDIRMGLALERAQDKYLLTFEKKPIWRFWDVFHDNIHVAKGQRIYCVSLIFAPRGLKTRLYHHWQYYASNKGWVSTERIGFELQGGRDNGFRGSTYKQNLVPGLWRVSVETENGRTVGLHTFNVLDGEVDPARLKVYRF